MKALILSMLIAFSMTPSFAQVVFSSRNMPSTCSYVFSVESDLKLELPLDSIEDEILYQLQNSWVPAEWTPVQVLALESSERYKSVEWTFTSMSLPEHHLYRNILITFPKTNIRCLSEFGRQFGEACIPGGRSQTSWKVRKLDCESVQ